MSAEMLKLDVDGMTCAACVASVEKIIEKSQHVKAVAVNLPLGSANIQLHQSADAETIQEILSDIKTSGFSANLHDESKPLRERLEKQVTNDGRKAGLALILALPTIYLTMFADDMGSFAGFDTKIILGASNDYASLFLVWAIVSHKRLESTTQRQCQHGCVNPLGNHSSFLLVSQRYAGG